MDAMLEGIRILDLSAVISGPMATGMLADQGAEVIKVEPPEIGDMTRHLGAQHGGVSAMFATVNRNKRSIVLDLKQPDGVAVLRRLAASCDAVVQNFRPGAAERMGIGYDDIRSEREDIVYLSISGFGRTGPYAHRKVYDPVMQTVRPSTDMRLWCNTCAGYRLSARLWPTQHLPSPRAVHSCSCCSHTIGHKGRWGPATWVLCGRWCT